MVNSLRWKRVSRKLRKNRKLAPYVGVWLLWGALTLIGWLLFGDTALVVAFILLGIALAVLQQFHYVRLKDALFAQFQQVEALFPLYANFLGVTQPLPPMRKYAISPDFAVLLTSLIFKYQPRTVLEMGSGVSTVITGYTLRQLDNDGHVFSLDHDPHYADISRGTVAQHGLDDLATIIDAPLKSVQIDGETWQWYDTASLKHIPPVDLVTVDGPPAPGQSSARYPAFPLLAPLLNDGALIILDDYSRLGEQMIVDRWLKTGNLVIIGTYPTEKGAVVLQYSKTKTTPQSVVETSVEQPA